MERNIGPRSQQNLELLAKLESLGNAGSFADVIELGESISARSGSAYFRGKVQLRLAQAYLHRGKPHLAKAPLAKAKRQFAAIGDAEMIVECMALEASVACTEQRPDALDLASEALRACRSLRPVPNALELAILSSVASSQVLVGQKADAIRTFEEAIARADPVVDMRRLAKLLGNAGIAYRELGELQKAINCSTRAVALFETLRDDASLAREENNLGCYLISCGALSGARSHLERSAHLFELTNLQVGRGLMLLSLCELWFVEGDLGRADAYADAALEAGTSQQEAWSVADAQIWRGRIAARLGDEDRADKAFQFAVGILEQSAMVERLLQCHAAYAEILEEQGDMSRAYEHLRKAFDIRMGVRDDGGTAE